MALKANKLIQSAAADQNNSWSHIDNSYDLKLQPTHRDNNKTLKTAKNRLWYDNTIDYKNNNNTSNYNKMKNEKHCSNRFSVLSTLTLTPSTSSETTPFTLAKRQNANPPKVSSSLLTLGLLVVLMISCLVGSHEVEGANSGGALRPGTGFNPSSRLPRTSASQLNSGNSGSNGTGGNNVSGSSSSSNGGSTGGNNFKVASKTLNNTRSGNLRTR